LWVLSTEKKILTAELRRKAAESAEKRITTAAQRSTGERIIKKISDRAVA